MNDERLRSYIQKRLGKYSHPVEDALWSDISKTISRRKKRIRFLRIISGLSAAMIAFTLALFILHDKDISEPVFVLQEQSQLSEWANVTNHLQPIDTSEVTNKQPLIQTVNKKLDILNTPKIIAKAEQVYETEIISDVQPTNTTDTIDVEQPVVKEKQFRNLYTNRMESSLSDSPNPIAKQRKQNNESSVLLAFSGALNGDSQNASMDFDTGGMYLGSDGKPIELVNPIYDFPVSFALTFRKGITDKLSLESGLSYTFLHTSYKESKSDIKLHYLGIPLKAIYSIHEEGRASFYGSIGGMVERQISGKLNHYKETNNLKNSNLQWSIETSAGVNLRLVKHIGLFAEPGITYFFHDGSNIPTIRKEKSLNFSLQVGLRFTIDK